MSLRGILSDFGSADVFQLIAQQAKTGRLEIERAGRVLEVLFIEGSVLRARPAEIRPDGALATVLLRSGAISEQTLDEAWRLQAETLDPLPELLVSRGMITQEEIDQLQRLINDETIFELFLWDEGKFAFEPCEVEPGRNETPVRAEMVLPGLPAVFDGQVVSGYLRIAAVGTAVALLTLVPRLPGPWEVGNLGVALPNVFGFGLLIPLYALGLWAAFLRLRTRKLGA